jgi:hypothetical protein
MCEKDDRPSPIRACGSTQSRFHSRCPSRRPADHRRHPRNRKRPGADLRRELSHQNADGGRPHRLRAGAGFRRSRARRKVLHRLRTAFGELGDPCAWRQRLGASLIGVYQRLSNPHIETLLHSIRVPLYKAGLTPKTPMGARVLLRAMKDGASPCFLADLRADSGPLCLSSDGPRDQLSFPRSSPARPVCRFTPAPNSAVRADVSAFASCPSQCRGQTTARRTLSSRRKHYSSNTRLSSARRPNNGCGRTGSGANRYRHHARARPGREESHRGGDHSSDSSRGFFSGRQSMIQPFPGLAEDLILSVSSTSP